MNGTNNGNRPEDMRSIAEEERTDSRDNGRQERTIGEIISDATDEELKHYHTGTLTPEELRSAVDKEQRAGRRRMLRRLTAAAALLMLVVAATVFAFENFTTDVDADKNAKEEIVTEDGVVIEYGGWGSSTEENWTITDWAEIKVAKEMIPKLVIPEYMPKGYMFESLEIETDGNVSRFTYHFKENEEKEIILQECIQEENLGSTQMGFGDRQVISEKGTIYLEENEENINAIIHLRDDINIYIWFNFNNDLELIEIVNHITI